MGELAEDAMYQASAEVLGAAVQLGDGRALASPEAVRQQAVDLLRTFVTRCRQAGVPDAETAEARYAIVAFIDDRILKSNWSGRAEWQKSPLQLQFYREFTAGENFYARMHALVQRGGPLTALESYYLCLVLGFAGAAPASAGPQAVRSYLEAARATLLRGRHDDRIAPHAVPSERHRTRPKPFPIILAAIGACLAVCLLGLLALYIALGLSLSQIGQDLTALGSGQVSSSGAR